MQPFLPARRLILALRFPWVPKVRFEPLGVVGVERV
jgi:hypothetical protein